MRGSWIKAVHDPSTAFTRDVVVWRGGCDLPVCFNFKFAEKMTALAVLGSFAHPVLTFATIATARLPVIYGIRMQADFAGIAERSEALAHALHGLRALIDDEDTGFDTLIRRIRWASDLLTEDPACWLQTYHARPLTLPG
jgi:hypothetical protein